MEELALASSGLVKLAVPVLWLPNSRVVLRLRAVEPNSRPE
jgi:hypothetical protein